MRSQGDTAVMATREWDFGTAFPTSVFSLRSVAAVSATGGLPSGSGSGYRRPMPPSNVTPDADQRLVDLLSASAVGDRAAFAELYDLTNARIYGLVLRVIRDANYAEEVVQEAYLQFWQRASAYQPDRGSVITWMMTIAHRRAIDRVRSEELHRRRSDEYGVASVAVADPLPLEVVMDHDETSSLRNCLDDLTTLQRSTIEMSYFNGLTYPQVAEQLGTPLPTVKSRIRDGLRRLRNCLRGRGHG